MPNTQGLDGIIISFVFLAFAAVILALRLVTRLLIVRNFGPEDWLISVAFICSLIYAIIVPVEVHFGQGRHIQDVSVSDTEQLLHALYGAILLYTTGLYLVKLSILYQYYRVFPGKKLRMAVYVLAGTCAGCGILALCLNAFMCSPVEKFWKFQMEGRCMPELSVWFTNSAFNIATDLAIFLLPMPALRKLQLPNRQRLGLMAVFALGGFVCVVSVVRLRSLYDIATSDDKTYENGPAAYWSAIEVNVGIICACTPSLKAFAARFFPRFLSNSTGHEGATSTAHRAGGAATMGTRSRHARQTIDDIELQKGWSDETALDPTKIQVVTMIEQAHEPCEEEDRESLNSSSNGATKHGRPTMTVTATGNWNEADEQTGHGHEVV